MYVQTYQTVYRKRKLKPKEVESICLDVKDTNNTRFIVCVCDRSPSECKMGHFISSLSNVIELMYRSIEMKFCYSEISTWIYTTTVKITKFLTRNCWNPVRDTVL